MARCLASSSWEAAAPGPAGPGTATAPGRSAAAAAAWFPGWLDKVGAALVCLRQVTTLSKYSCSSFDSTCCTGCCTCTAPSDVASAAALTAPAAFAAASCLIAFAGSGVAAAAAGLTGTASGPGMGLTRFPPGFSRSAFSGMTGWTPFMNSQWGTMPTSKGGRCNGASTTCSKDSSLSWTKYTSGCPVARTYFAGSLLLNPYTGSKFLRRSALLMSSTVNFSRLECLANLVASCRISRSLYSTSGARALAASSLSFGISME
mmetsp:Transcript_40187/g.89169  ORF Transcript_40187/g.89169 Transcript_40187/m.89169 type:complete len:261 (-) Transcript_40187:123-905(-)